MRALKNPVDRMLAEEPIHCSNEAIMTWRRLGPLNLNTFLTKELPFARVQLIHKMNKI